MTYEQALAYIHGRPRPAERPAGQANLDRFRLLLARLGHPQKALRIVHIAGSSGKGSTATLCESVLRHAGLRTGLFVSPYVFDFRERIQLGGQWVEKETLCRAAALLAPHVAALEAEGVACTEFDIVTALAFLIFQEAGCQIVCLEVGIGGLLDRTNAIDPPEVAAICSISLEHTDVLGGSLREIAAHKCGIIKPGCRVAAYGRLPPEALAVLAETCARHGIVPHMAEPGALEIVSMDAEGSDFRYRGARYRLAMAGEHQILNALTVLAIVDGLREAGWDLPPRAVAEGLEQARFVGRLQTVRRNPRCLLDGAHNPEKISSLCRALARLYPGRRMIALMGMKAEKDYAWCIPEIARRSAVFVAVTPAGMPRPLAARRAARVAAPHCPDVRVAPSVREGAALAAQLAGPDDLVVACGSLYILSAAREGFLAAP